MQHMRFPPDDEGRVRLVVQRVRTRWTKASRGGQAASVRNATPVAFPLPLRVAPLLHLVTMDEWDGFQARLEHMHELPPQGDLELRETESGVRVRVVDDPWGMPRRHRRPPAVVLQPGEWVRWQINFRYGLDHGWSYALDTWNIANGVVGEDAFLGPPPRTVDERENLW